VTVAQDPGITVNFDVVDAVPVTLTCEANFGAPATIDTAIVPTAPGAPAGVSATAGNGQISVAWTAPADDGGSPVTGYVVTAATAGGGTTFAETLNSPVTSAILGGLANGAGYDVTVSAVNDVGTGPAAASADNPVTPTSAAPLITSANDIAVAVGGKLSFKVTAVGSPKPALAASGLPSWLTLTPAAKGGSATLAGTAPAGSGGVCPVTFTAANGVGFPVTQAATLSATFDGVTATQKFTLTTTAG
jgi:Fibronectin type III domain